MATKTIHQTVDANGQCTAPACSAPGWFVHTSDQIEVEHFAQAAPRGAQLMWGPVFGEPEPGHEVDFYSTGAEYFAEVAAAISAAKKSVFIAGWQINYDVELVGQKTLFHCLQDAMKGGATVYVMPWLAPPPLETGYLATLLAVIHLNGAGLAGKAHCLPALAQSDQGTMNIGFSHHQKLVLVDNERAFMGGIDLAYGRRDDARFSLKADTRRHNEFYSTCIPPVHPLNRQETQNYVTQAELLAAAFTRGLTRSAATFATSPSAGKIAWGLDVIDTGKDKLGDAVAATQDWWNSVNLLRDVTNAVQDKAVDTAQGASRWAWDQLDRNVREQLVRLRVSGSANAADAASAVIGWLHGASLDQLPPSLVGQVATLSHALVLGLVAGVSSSANAKPERYDRLFENVKAAPPGTHVHDTAVQPRMPWQDVQCSIKGPAVYDLSKNFVRRWNSVALTSEQAFSRVKDPIANKLLQSAGMELAGTPRLPRVATAHLPRRSTAKPGQSWVQVLRSAPLNLVERELAAQAAVAGVTKPQPAMQNNCLKAILKVIQSARHFLYIEGQFFQSAHGQDGAVDASLSGPLGALMDLRRSPGYARFAQMLDIVGVPVAQIPTRMRWAKVDDVMREAKGPAFMRDVERVLANITAVEVSRLLGKPQDELKNPVAQALVNAVMRALNDNQPFHIYMVLPVHPEGTLDTLNIVTQVHLTMHSLVFGDHSLVNGIRRAILTDRLRRERKISLAQARKEVQAMDVEDIVKAAREDWRQFLTLLNLRNWDILGGKPVTEQIYVHSKLVIADDRVAVLGSANINDRSLWGDRDSELAVIINDDAPKTVKLDGVRPAQVGACVHKLRRSLWEKHFGMHSGNRKAAALCTDAILDSPAAPATWKAIQARANLNAQQYEDAFWFIPRSGARPEVQPKEAADKEPGPPPGSVWPTWKYPSYLNHSSGGKLLYRMPFDPLFWREAERDDAVNTWNLDKDKAQAMAPSRAPDRVEGFIVALPTNWTYRENNQSGMNLTLLANLLLEKERQTYVAQNAPKQPNAEVTG